MGSYFKDTLENIHLIMSEYLERNHHKRSLLSKTLFPHNNQPFVAKIQHYVHTELMRPWEDHPVEFEVEQFKALTEYTFTQIHLHHVDSGSWLFRSILAQLNFFLAQQFKIKRQPFFYIRSHYDTAPYIMSMGTIKECVLLTANRLNTLPYIELKLITKEGEPVPESEHALSPNGFSQM